MKDWDYPTRSPLFKSLQERFGPFDLDPCCTAENRKAPAYYTVAHDGLRQPWHGVVYMNPPYNRGVIELWMAKAVAEIQRGQVDRIIAVIPASTCAAWWHKWVEPFADEIATVPGRQHFDNIARPAFSTCIVIFRRGSTRRLWADPIQVARAPHGGARRRGRPVGFINTYISQRGVSGK